MSSSKGLGLNGEELLTVLPPEVARFLMIKTEPNRAVEFNPKGTDIIPKLFDEYQKAAKAYYEKTDEDLARSFELSQMGAVKKPPALRFSILAQWVQMPNMAEEIKKEGLEEWATYARVWVEKYAPESEKFLIQNELPESAKSLSDKQKEYLQKISEGYTDSMSAEDVQTFIYELSKEIAIPSKEAFAAIYAVLLGKNHGPRAAWLIKSVDKEFIKKRFQAI